eukprot:scaffold14195_cov65-Cyclotella_meneghiniana.AAC.9
MINGVNSSLQPDRNQKEDSARTAKDEDHPHVHFSPRPTIRRLPSQTKAWTDQAAPEPFSTPRQRKLGYGDYLSRKEICNSGNDGGVNRVAYPNSHHDKSSCSNTVFRRSKSHDVAAANINGMHMATKERGISFAQHDFPSLSPIKPQLKPSRAISWSSVARNDVSRSVQMEEIQQTEKAYTTLNMIPPPPLSEVQSPPFIKPQVSFRNEPDNIQLCNSLVETLQETELSQSFPPSLHETLYESKQHLRSSSFSSATYHCPEYSPFDTFTTMSRSCLQNDIGTLLARYNRIEEAIERFEHSIEVATVDRDGLMVALEHLSASSEVTSESIIHPEPKSKCPKVTEAEGLAWFHQKLLKGDVAAAPLPANTSSNSHNHSRNQSNSQYPFQPAGFGGLAPMSATTRRIRSASFGVDTMSTLTSRSVDHDTSTEESYMPSHPLTAPYPAKSTVIFGDVKDNSHTNSTRQPFSTKPPKERHSLKPFAVLDDMEIYSCNGFTPLGLEYIVDPLPVLGSRLRKLVAECLAEDELEDFGILPNICEASATKRRKRMIAALLMDSAALIASKINMAGLRYKRGYDLNELLSILQHALDDFASVRKVIDNDPLNNELLCRDSFMDVFGLLEIVGHLNLGVLLYRLNKIRDAMTSFESARDKLELKKNLDNKTHGISCTHTLLNNEQHPHDDNRLPSSEYLLLAIQVSTARAFLRLNDPDNAEKICQSIAEENKPHRRNSSRLHHRAISSHSFGGGYARSDSFSLTTSAVNTALAAYQFNIDRRYNWLLLVAENYLNGLKHETRGEVEDYQCAVTYYNRILSETRKKFDHRHPFVCSILERRGEVLFEQRKLQCSMLSYLACLKIIEHQQLTKSVSYREEEMARILYSVARVLHDKEDYHDAIGMYQRALVCQRSLAGDKPSLNVITTLCNISRVHHLCGEIDEALATNKEVLILATKLVGGKMDHPFLIHRLKVEGNILIEAGRIEDAMTTFIDAARRCCKDGQNRMITTLMGAGENSREDADAGDSSVLSMRSAAALAHIAFLHPAAPAG